MKGRFGKIGLIELHFVPFGSLQTGSLEIAIAQIGSFQFGLSQSRPRKVRRSEVPGAKGQLKRHMRKVDPVSAPYAREMKKFGYDVRLMSPRFVKPYIKKHDQADGTDPLTTASAPNFE